MTHTFPTRRSSDLLGLTPALAGALHQVQRLGDAGEAGLGATVAAQQLRQHAKEVADLDHLAGGAMLGQRGLEDGDALGAAPAGRGHPARSEEHTSELQSLMRISYAVFCLKK